MSALRDKIADVIANCDMHRDSFRDIADAIALFAYIVLCVATVVLLVGDF